MADKRTESGNRNHDRMVAVMAMLGALGKASSTGLDEAINESLEQLGRAEEVDRAYVFLFEHGLASNTHEWCAPGIDPLKQQLQNLPLSDASWWVTRLLAGDDIHIGRVADLPPEAERERELLKAQSVQSLLSVPIHKDEAVIGLLGFDAVSTPRSWDDDAILLIRAAAEGLGHAFARQGAEASLAENEANYRAFFESMTDLVFVADEEGRILFSNPAASAKLGYPPEGLLTMRIMDLHPLWLQAEVEAIVGDMLAGRRASCPLPLITSEGALVPVETRVSMGAWSGRTCILGISKDLSHEQEALQKFEKLFEMNPALMAVSTVPGGEFVNVNAAFLRVLGYSAEELVGRTSAEIDLFVNPEGQQQVAARLAESGHVRDVELQVRTKQGEIRDGLFSGEIIESQGKEYFLTVMVDITERKRLEAKINTLSMTDELTGLSNRRGFKALARQQLKLGDRDQTNHGLFFIDLNNMKWINDQLGHGEGDRALVEAAAVLKDTFRETDIVARVGGDEFAVLAIDMDDEIQGALEERLAATLESHNALAGSKFELSFSVGVAQYSHGSGTSLDGLISEADARMYEHKRSGSGKRAPQGR